jgi:hypothetical protein
MVVPPSVADNGTPDVSIAKLFRAWLLSTLVCAGLLALWVVLQAVLYGRTAHLWLNVINVAVPFAALFAVTLTIYMAVFGLIERWKASPVSRNAAVVLGAVLAPLSYAAIAAWFHESDDPQTLGGWIRFWAAHLPAVLVAMLPFAVAGAVFGLLWPGTRRRT